MFSAFEDKMPDDNKLILVAQATATGEEEGREGHDAYLWLGFVCRGEIYRGSKEPFEPVSEFEKAELMGYTTGKWAYAADVLGASGILLNTGHEIVRPVSLDR